MKMNKETRKKIYTYLFVSYVLLIPLINSYVKMLERHLGTNLHTVDINPFNLFTVR